jgi:diadenosine tetraphosphatase ApaH/serine/threonine PP2A family protein phosphatase
MSGRLLAIGDIHGCLDPFRELVEQKIRLTGEDRLVLLGDYIDRGISIREVIDYIIDLRERGFDIVTLMGNHESMLLDSCNSEKSLYNWFLNGGYDTLASFGIESVNELDSKYLEFFSNLLYYYRMDPFIFVHAGFNDEISDPFEDKVQMIWSRRESYANPVFARNTIVHGHTPIPLSVCQEEIMSGSRVINIDTGCVYDKSGGYGYLTGIELFTREIFSV